MRLLRRLLACAAIVSAAFGFLLGSLGSVLAEGGQPTPWQTGFQPAASPTMHQIKDFNDFLLILIVAIVVFVMGLLIYVMYRFSEKRNPNPSKTTHNTLIEIIWTTVPVIILALIVIPSFKLLYFADSVAEADMTVKAIGRQWYWSYEYPDHGNFIFDSNMVADEDLEPGQPRLLQTDTAFVLPVNTKIRLLITASDVLHAFAMPSMGLKLDAVPGRVNETWVEILEEGYYYGQCSELCGTAHSYMPIMIKAVSKAEFETWVKQAEQEYSQNEAPQTPAEPDSNVRLAATSE